MLDFNKVYCMDCLVGLRLLDDNSVDAIVTDPPYNLGFMGKEWDSSGISFRVELWRECLRVLRPGGFLLSFAGSGTTLYACKYNSRNFIGFEIDPEYVAICNRRLSQESLGGVFDA